MSQIEKLKRSLDARRFKDDIEVQLYVVPHDRSDEDSIKNLSENQHFWFSEILFSRILHLGQAYNLHYARVINFEGDTYLNKSQCQSVCTELEFLQTFINDPALNTAIETTIKALTLVERQKETQLFISV